MITISQKDALKAEVLPPGWQICKVTEYNTKTKADDGSVNHIYSLEVADGKYKGVPLQDIYINEKAIGMGKDFFIACGMPEDAWDAAKNGEVVSFEETSPVNQYLKVNVTPEKFGNRMLNKAGGFLKLTDSERAKFEGAIV